MSPPARITSKGLAIRNRASSLETHPTGSCRPSATPPPLKEEKGVSSRPFRSSTGGLYVLSSKQDEGEASSFAHTLMRGVVTPKDRRLLIPLPREDLEKKAGMYLMKADPALAIPRTSTIEGPVTQPPTQVGDVPPQWLAQLEYLQKGLQDVQYQVMGAPVEEQACIPFTERVIAEKLPVNCRTPTIAEYDGTIDPQEHLSQFENATLLHRYTDGIKCLVFVTTFARAAQRWFNQLPLAVIGSFQEFCSIFLHRFASCRKHRKTELSLFSIRQKEGEPLKEYLQRFTRQPWKSARRPRKLRPASLLNDC
ncbi:UNVERIFIED_CONTAM: hypothetical protein Sradi_7292200 [Sesamum radiatum]|uniref:Retrotransposon gag domain-containing protein n=1 Tax=Sesamum radiatum TaxID=300843 RepID=A0AAW2IJ29_SESRA